MKQFSLSANNSIELPLKRSRPDPARHYYAGRARGSIAAAAVLTGLAAGLMALAQPVQAQTSSRQDLRNDNAVIRERARQSQRDFQDRMRRGHEIGRQRSIDTNERVRQEHQRQQDQLDALRRQR
jgi:hypothetical protein